MKIVNCKLKIVKPKVLVATSGGVDSSVAAAILKKNGYEVVGVFMRMHDKSNSRDARKVTQKLKIPFRALDVRKEFKKLVIDYFIHEHKIGNTPNPCVECNPQIKFKFLIDLATKLKFDYVATGHYVRPRRISLGLTRLFIAKDTKKDQSYFLWQLTQKQLSKIIFPLGDYTKEQVRELAKKWKLPVHEKESQDICFSSNADARGFLKSQIHAERGSIITKDGKKIGEHKGLPFYTVGQRKRIEIGPPRLAKASRREAGETRPYYVVRKDFKNNTLIVSQSQKDLLQKEMFVKSVNWLSGKPFSGKCKAKIRSMAPMVLCQIFKIQNSKFKIRFIKPQRAITPGQSAVFYLPRRSTAKAGKGNELLGGGIIT